MRKVLAAAGCLLVALVVTSVAPAARPAAAQSAPPAITIDPTSDTAATSGTWTIQVSGVRWAAGRVVSISFAGVGAGSATPASNGTFTTTITPARRTAGQYDVVASQNPCSPTAVCTVTASATFTAVPVLTLDPPCSTTGTPQTLTVSGAGWGPGFAVTVTYDVPSETIKTVSAGKDGTFSVTFDVTPPNRDVVVRAEQGRTESDVRVTWSRCPPPGVTTTSTTATTIPPITTAPVATTTTAPGTPTTSPVVTVPPTPGVVLTVVPSLGPPGFVALAKGTGFPPGPVSLAWVQGIGTFTATADATGAFETSVLVFPRDRLGPRLLVASGTVNASAPFLVVPSTVQPSGKDVAQITRTRRLLQR